MDLTYHGEAKQTLRPEVTVVNAGNESNSKVVPDSKLVDGNIDSKVTLELPTEWFSEGENTVYVRTPDGSLVHAEFEASGLNYQLLEFETVGEQ